MKKILSFVLLAVMSVSVAAACSLDGGGNGGKIGDKPIEQDEYQTFVTLDLNPSIGFYLNEEDEIYDLIPLNEDGEILLEDENFKVDRKALPEFVSLLIDEAINLDFINDQSEVNFDIDALVDNENEDIRNSVFANVEARINERMNERGISASIRERVHPQDLITRANENGVSPSKQRMAEEISKHDPNVDVDEILERTPAQVQNMLRDKISNNMLIARENIEEFKNEKEIIITNFYEIITILETQIEETELDDEEVILVLNQIEEAKQDMEEALEQLKDEYLSFNEVIRDSIRDEREKRDTRIDNNDVNDES